MSSCSEGTICLEEETGCTNHSISINSECLCAVRASTQGVGSELREERHELLCIVGEHLLSFLLESNMRVYTQNLVVIIDSGASAHMLPLESLFDEIDTAVTGSVSLGDMDLNCPLWVVA